MRFNEVNWRFPERLEKEFQLNKNSKMNSQKLGSQQEENAGRQHQKASGRPENAASSEKTFILCFDRHYIILRFDLGIYF